MAPNFYATRADVQVVAICFRDQHPQIQGTVKAGGKCQVVFGSGGRAAIQDGDYILFGEDGKPVSTMPAKTFTKLFGLVGPVEAPEASGLVLDGPMMGESPVNAPSADSATVPEDAPALPDDTSPEPPTTEPTDAGSIFGEADAPDADE